MKKQHSPIIVRAKRKNVTANLSQLTIIATTIGNQQLIVTREDCNATRAAITLRSIMQRECAYHALRMTDVIGVYPCL